MTQPDDKRDNGLGAKITAIANDMTHLSSGDMARLKRGPLKKGAPAFWRLGVRHDFAADDDWAAIIQAMAILALRSDDGQGFKNPHNQHNRLGRALCNGGDESWKGGSDARPAFSELRLARLLNVKGDGRRDMLLRAIRMIARAGTPVNCTDFAWLILKPDEAWPVRRIARDYYSHPTFAERETTENAA